MLVILTCFVAWFFLWKTQSNLEQRVQALSHRKALYMAAAELEKLWSGGNYKNINFSEVECPLMEGELDQMNRRFRQCNPDLLNCWLTQKKDRLAESLRQEDAQFTVGEESLDISFTPQGRVVQLELINKEFDLSQKVTLLDSCRDSYLPEGQYALGTPVRGQEDWFWDNTKRAIFVDKFPVTNRDIREWMEYADFEEDQRPQLDFKMKNDVKWLMSPANKLTSTQQNLFCATQGRSVLKAHIFDASAFYPSSVKDAKNKPRGPYPEGLRRQDSYLGLTQALGETIDTEKLCLSFYSQECLNDEPFYAQQARASSWMGVFHVLGGEFEHLPNITRPKRNLKLSSYHYPLNSKWHRIAERGFWDGEGHGSKNFNWRTQDPEKKEDYYGVSFRCSTLRKVGGRDNDAS